MNIIEIEKQVLPYLIKLAESPPVQAEIEAAKAAIISIVETQSLSIAQRLLRWIKNKLFKRGNVKMAKVTITVKNSEGSVLSGAAVSYSVSGISTSGTTDINGQLEIEGLSAGIYTFTASLSDYTSASTDITVTDADVSSTITLAAEATTTEGESNVSVATSVKDVAEDAAKESLSESLTSDNSNQVTYLTNLADERIAKWKADSARTSDSFVKFRNSIYIMDLKAAKAAVKAGGTVAIALLAEKLLK